MEAAVLVLGMHRSGTSALTRCINLMGVATGRSDDLVSGGEANPNGYWESGLLQRLNNEILAAWDATWYAPPRWPKNWSASSRLTGLRQRGRCSYGAMLHLRKTGHKRVVYRVHLSLIKNLPRILISRCAVVIGRRSGSTRRIAQWMDRHEDTYQELGQAAAVGRYYEDIRKRNHENPAS